MRRILLTFDFSAHAERALALALCGVPFGTDVTLDVLHVLDERLHKGASVAAIRALSEEKKRLFKNDVARLSSVRRRLKDDPRLKVVCGDPTQEILTRAANYEGILIGGKGHGTWSETLLGTTATRVVRDTLASVYVTKKATSLVTPIRLLCAVDKDIGSRRALTEAAALCHAQSAELHMLRVVPIASPGFDLRREQDALAHFERSTLAVPVARQHLVALAVGGVATAILHHAAQENIDTIVVGARERDLSKRLFGSASEALVQQGSNDVYVVR